MKQLKNPISRHYSYVNILLIVHLLFLVVYSDVDFCYNGRLHKLIKYPMYSESFQRAGSRTRIIYCRYGLLFKTPIRLHAINSDPSKGFCIKRSICPNLNGNVTHWQCGVQKQDLKVQMLSVNPHPNEMWDFLLNDKLIRTEIPECKRAFENPKGIREVDYGQHEFEHNFDYHKEDVLKRKKKSISSHIPLNEFTNDHLEDVSFCLRSKKDIKYKLYEVEKAHCF